MVENIVETVNLTKRFDNFIAVDNLNLEIKSGEIFGLLGHNGAGKTTTINMLTGLIAPTQGTARVCGYDIIEQPLEARRRIGLLPDNAGIYPNLTAYQNLKFFSELAELPEQEAETRINELLELVRLTEWRDVRVEKYSRGMKQRLGLAQSLIRDPELLFFDEPTQGIDPEGTILIRELMNKLAKHDGKTILLTTHLLHEANQICDRIAIMRNGRIIAEGTIDELKDELELSQNNDLMAVYLKIHKGIDASSVN